MNAIQTFKKTVVVAPNGAGEYVIRKDGFASVGPYASREDAARIARKSGYAVMFDDNENSISNEKSSCQK